MDYLASKALVTGLHVSQIEVRKHIRRQCQEAIAHCVPEKEDAMGVTASKAGAKHYISLILQNWVQELRVLGRVVLQICILKQHKITLGDLNTRSQSSALPTVYLVIQNL